MRADRRRERFDHLILRRADELDEPLRELLVVQACRRCASLAAATRASVPISRSMLTICLMRRSHSQKPMIVSMRSSRRKILSTVVLYLWRRLELVERPPRPRHDARQPARRRRPPAPARVRDHGAVVGAQRRPRIVHARADSPAELREARAQRAVGADAAGDDEPRRDPSPRAPAGTYPSACRRRRLETTPRRRRAPAPATSRRRRGTRRSSSRAAVFKPLKLMSSPWFFSGRGSANRRASPRSASAASSGPAGIRQPEQPRDLVERLAGRVVERFADDPVAAHARDLDQLGMAARHHQGEERKLGRRRPRACRPGCAPRGGARGSPGS